MENFNAIAERSGLTCPDCGGGLWELDEDKPLRFRCHTADEARKQSGRLVKIIEERSGSGA